MMLGYTDYLHTPRLVALAWLLIAELCQQRLVSIIALSAWVILLLAHLILKAIWNQTH